VPPDIIHVDGRDAGKVFLYALSTCVWCKRTKRLLDQLGVAYDYVEVDTLDPDTRAKATRSLREWNPAGSYPTLVVNERDCIVGFDEPAVRKALGL
jgi:glutaredoxin-like protein NrdH